ncbi:cadherin-like beta sandwich domain-containing protein [Metabacillus halosaccharovorans]|uniref:Cadherin-like beta sandwich domain-containing protein n=1 Tax=Metabacillus halosaccharovorans TaxID=930124 RepID=A0ABT3DN74_9BACI|nr:cadherin-like beta sandwich domain-containing protein [Metabacillus halosaccharovorans]MCV9888513.1 cadherin-like beta sandwich domain-containing protein [Metabacillus halosaccharovorans]
MRRNLGIKLIAAGTIIGANVSAYPISHVHAEEMTILENSAELQSVKIDEFQLDQAFSHDVKRYSASVGNEIKTMNILVEKKEEAALITINGEAIESGVKTSLPLSTGNNEFEITVTNGTEVSSYKLTVVRAKNDNNQLSNLSLSNGSLSFDSEKSDYHIEVKNEISELTLKPKTKADTSTVTINGATVKSGEGHEVQLPVGSTTMTIIVTAENGTKKIYTVTVARQAQQDSSSIVTDEKKDQSGEIQPTTETSSNSSKASITPSTTESNNRGTSSIPSEAVLATTNVNSSTKNSANLGSSSATGTSETKTTANLNSLTVSNGTWSKTFSSDVYTYHISLASDVSSLTISADAEESDADIFIEDEEISDNSTVTIGDKTKTAISVIVENDEDRKTYVLIFEKEVDEEVTIETVESIANTETEAATVSSDTKGLEVTSETNQMNDREERQEEKASIWQKLLAFFGL